MVFLNAARRLHRDAGNNIALLGQAVRESRYGNRTRIQPARLQERRAVPRAARRGDTRQSAGQRDARRIRFLRRQDVRRKRESLARPARVRGRRLRAPLPRIVGRLRARQEQLPGSGRQGILPELRSAQPGHASRGFRAGCARTSGNSLLERGLACLAARASPRSRGTRVGPRAPAGAARRRLRLASIQR